jgi:hypothetical protein
MKTLFDRKQKQESSLISIMTGYGDSATGASATPTAI